MRNDLKTYVASEGAVSQNVLDYQQLSIACYQVSFYANNFCEKQPMVSSAFKQNIRICPNSTAVKYTKLFLT